LIVECPHCCFKEDVPQEYAGATGVCDNCGCEYTIGKTPSPEEARKLAWQSTAKLTDVTDKLRKSCKASTDDKEAVSLYNKLAAVKKEISRRYEVATNHSIDTFRQNIPFLLKPFASLFLKFRKASEQELLLQDLSSKMDMVLREASMHTKALVQKEQERQARIAAEARRKAEEERRLKAEAERQAMVVRYVEEVTMCIKYIHENRQPRPINYENFSYQGGEIVYYVAKNISCRIPKKHDSYKGGTFVLTNKRIVYSAEQHVQTFRMKNLKDFNPRWCLDSDWVTIATSDTRREMYYLPSAWLATLIMQFFANDAFQEKLLLQDAEASVKFIWNKIVGTSSQLHTKLFDPLEDIEKAKQKDDDYQKRFVEELNMLIANNGIDVCARAFLEHYRNEYLSPYTTAEKRLKALDKIHKVYEDYSLQKIVDEKKMESNLRRRSRFALK